MVDITTMGTIPVTGMTATAMILMAMEMTASTAAAAAATTTTDVIATAIPVAMTSITVAQAKGIRSPPAIACTAARTQRHIRLRRLLADRKPLSVTTEQRSRKTSQVSAPNTL